MKFKLSSLLQRSKQLGLLTTVTLGIIGCGDEPLVSRFNYDVSENEVVDLEMEFNRDVQLNTELNVPIKEYGFVRLLPSTDNTGLIIGTSLNMSIIDDEDVVDLEKTRRLPNGQRMPSYVDEDLIRIRVEASDDVWVSVYLGPSDNLFLGIATEIWALDEEFMPGLVITQRLKDPEDRYVGAVSLYGSEVEDDTLVNPGGVFVVTNVTDLIEYYPPNSSENDFSLAHHDENLKSYVPLVQSQEFKVNDPYRRHLKSRRNLYKMFKLMKQKLKNAKLVD